MADQSERDRLVSEYLPLVSSIAGKLKKSLCKHAPHEDLVGYGSRGLIEAAERYDAAQGVAFSTFAYYRIRGAMLDGVRSMSWYSRADYARYKAEESANEYLESNARDQGAKAQAGGNASKTAEILGSIASSLSAVAAVHIVSMEAAESMPDSTFEAPDAAFESHQMRGRVREAIKTLPEKERQMLEAHYFKGQSLLDAGKAMGLSKSWASRLHARAVNRLKEQFETLEAQEMGGTTPEPATEFLP